MSDYDALSFEADFDPDDEHPPFLEEGEEMGVPDDWLEGETLAERNARIRARMDQETQRNRPRLEDELLRAWERGATEADPERHVIRTPAIRSANTSAQHGDVLREPRQAVPAAPVRVSDDGGSTWEITEVDLDDDLAKIDAFFQVCAKEMSYTVTKLLRPQRPGRPSPEEAARRAALAVIVAAARDRRARYEALASYLNRPLSSVAALETDGRKLSG